MTRDCFSMRMGVSLAAVLSLFMAGCGLFDSSGGSSSLPSELVRFGDTESDAELTTIRDLGDDPDEFVTIGTDGQVQFADCSLCDTCTADGTTIDVDGNVVSVRFTDGLTDPEERRAYLVSEDCFFINLVRTDSGVSFSESNLEFESGENACTVDPEIAGESDNPCVDTSSSGGLFPACATGMMTGLVGTFIGILGLALVRKPGRSS